SSSVTSSRSATCRVGRTSTCPGAYGYFASAANASASRRRIRSPSGSPSSRSAQKTHRSSTTSLVAWRYSIRHGLHRCSTAASRGGEVRRLEASRRRLRDERRDDLVERHAGRLDAVPIPDRERPALEIAGTHDPGV